MTKVIGLIIAFLVVGIFLSVWALLRDRKRYGFVFWTYYYVIGSLLVTMVLSIGLLVCMPD